MKNNIIEKAQNLCKENSVTLLHLCKYGYHLYGTNTSESDSGYKE